MEAEKQYFPPARARYLALALILAIFFGRASSVPASAVRFAVKPYLQLGNNSRVANPEGEQIRWLTPDRDAKWKVQLKEKDQVKWRDATAGVTIRSLPWSLSQPMYLMSCDLKGLLPGQEFEYRVLSHDTCVFSSSAKTRPSPAQPYQFAVVGDMGAGTAGEKKVAYECFRTRPDLLLLVGDIVYNRGLFSEYLEKFTPVYNADEASPDKGAPLLRSVVAMPVLGNHDVALSQGGATDFDGCRDALAYFVLWSAPLNGPLKNVGCANTPKLGGSSLHYIPFEKSAGNTYPCMANYSFDYGNSHWLVLDANDYMDWTDPALRRWVDRDLSGSKAAWKFVSFHQPGFSRDIEHSKEQRMRLLSDIFQKDGVDVVFCGHAHDYQRTFPLRFNVRTRNGAMLINADGTVDGDIILDREFDGKTKCKPKGVIYLVSGAGGAQLYACGPNLFVPAFR